MLVDVIHRCGRAIHLTRQQAYLSTNGIFGVCVVQKDKACSVHRYAYTAEERLRSTLHGTRTAFGTDQLRLECLDELPDGLCLKVFVAPRTILAYGCIVVIAGRHASCSPTGKMGTAKEHVIVDATCTS